MAPRMMPAMVAALALLVSQATAGFIEIELVSNTLSDYEDRIETAITNAATNWSNVIRTEHDAITFEEKTSLSDYCGIDYTFASGDSVDNLLILVQVIANGEDASFITAKPCIFAESDDTYFTRVGVITVNSDSSRTVKMLDHYHFEEIVEHEIGHVLGVGSLWDAFGLVDADSKTYTGSKGIWGYQLVGGDAEGVPLDVNSSSIYHWSQSVFEDELMTGTQYGHDQPLSTLTVSSLRDLGYKVWPQNSDEFELSTDSPSSTTTNSNAPKYLIDLYMDFESVDVSASVPVFSNGAVSYAVIDFEVSSSSSSTSTTAASEFVKMELVSNTLSDYEDRIQTAITNAATNWSNVIRTEHDAITFEEKTSLSDYCGIDYTFASGDSVDNLLILVQVIANGEDASFITAKPCIFAESDDTYFTRVGVITVNSDSSRTVKMLDHYHFEEIIEHEIGHVLGVGSLWDAFGLVDADSKTYTGSKGIWGYQLVGGDAGASVPLDVNSSSIYHWSQSVFEDELMTGTQYGHDQPLSTLTVSSLRDLGYKVWPQNSDEFELSTDSTSSTTTNSNAPTYLIDLYSDFEPIDVSASVPIFSDGAVKYAVVDFTVVSASVANKSSGWEIATTVLAVIFFCTTVALGSAWYCKSRSLVNIETQSNPSEPDNIKDLERASPAEEHASAVRLH